MTITNKIQVLIGKYNETPLEATYLNQLMDIRQSLVCLSFNLGVEVAKYKREFDASNYKRKINFFQLKNDNLASGVTKAETLAEVQIKELRAEEKANESLYTGSKIILNQVNEVLSSLQQDLSILKSELNNQ